YYNDHNIYGGNAQNEFTLGKWLLVCPTTTQQQYSKIYLPEGEWYHFFTDEKVSGNNHYVVETTMEDLPVYAKAGAIIPLQNVVQTTQQKSDGILRLHVYHGAVKTEQVYYEDDGQTYDFKKGSFFKRMIQFDGIDHNLVFQAAEGTLDSEFKTLKIYLHGFDANDYQINGESVNYKVEDIRLIEPITEFDPLPQREKRDYQIKNIRTIETAMTKAEIKITWS
ncbi:MAG TPA: DUF5110 domain-containing protein, partial [Roseivirga sp.]